MKKRRKKSFPYALLFLLIAVFLVTVDFLASRPEKPLRKIWVAPVKVVEQQQPPGPAPEVQIPADELKPPPDLAAQPEPSAERALAQKVAPVLPPTSDGRLRIAIVIDDLGLNEANTQKAIELPAGVTLSFLPYATNLAKLTEKALAAGHELLLHMPMEPIGHENPGEGALLTSQTPDEIRTLFDKALARFPGFDGVNNHMGSKFTSDRARMEIVVNMLRERNLFFLDSYTAKKSVAAEVAREAGVATETRDVFLDDEASLAAINAQLAQTERVARKKGYAIAIGHPNPALLTALKYWIPEAERQGFLIAPVREVVR